MSFTRTPISSNTLNLSDRLTRAQRDLTDKGLVIRVLSNSLWIAAGEAVGRGLFFLAHVHLARALGVSKFGVLTLAQTITYYLWFAVDLGTNMYGVKEISRQKSESESLINALMTLRVLAGICVFVSYAATLSILPVGHADRAVFLACGLYLVTNGLYGDWVFKGFERFDYIAVGSTLTSVFFLGVSLWLVRGPGNLVAGSLSWSLAYLPGAIILLLLMNRKLRIRWRPSFDLQLWFHHLRESIYFATSGILLSAYQYVPLLLVSVFFTSYEVGWFAAGYRTVITINGGGFLMAMAFYPILSELHHKDRLQFQRAHAWFRATMLLVGIPFGVFGYLYTHRIIHLLFGTAYAKSDPTFRILVWLVPMYFLRFTYGTTLLASGLQKKHNLATLTAFVSVLVFGLVLQRGFGPSGVAWALLIAEALMVVVMHSLLRNVFRPDPA